ncbi:glycosyltransferase [Calothrix sp. UHCC 0171]|uniref:glycosyltransferase family 39 protein n=1 Tax=Calothrix sp. UHCC 0171 TaxID=3110245 RepID=UPI002B1FFD64|nr:glycosyltransferase [Calothrix sp. UHCC 0171]MEA5573790.1 glycosyltransferase [Calothrix sp. UHCC 0171]
MQLKIPKVQESQHQDFLLLLLWFTVALILRFINLGAKPPWTDEFSTLVFSLGNSFLGVPLDQAINVDVLLEPLKPRVNTSIQDVFKHLFTESNHPPIYFILTHFWLRLFPTDDGLVSVWGARALAAILGGVTVPATYALSWLVIKSRLVSHLAAIIMATSPYGIFLAQETRHYTLAILWVIASLACFLISTQHLKNNTKLSFKVVLIWVIVNALGIATHYFFVLTLSAQVIVLIYLFIREFRKEENGENQNILTSSWYRILVAITATVVAGAVWIPIFLQNSYGGKLTEWIQGERSGLAWLSPIFQALAAWITMISLLPVESPQIPIIIASGLVMLAFFIWITPILLRGLNFRLQEPKNQFLTHILLNFIIASLAIFFILTYFFGIDLTRGARYNFVYFPSVIVLIASSLAICWQTAKIKIWRWQISGKKAVAIVCLMSLTSAITVVNNLGYQKYYRPDLFVELIQKTSQVPVLIATTQKTHVHIGEMMGVAREFKIREARKKTNKEAINHVPTKFVLAHQDDNPETSTVALRKILEKQSNAFDLWLVNFYADKPEELDTCVQEKPILPAINGYEYKLFHCQ